MKSLQQHHWPGNVRELKNIIEHAVIITPDDKLRIEMSNAKRPKSTVRKTLNEVQKDHILEVLGQVNWRVRGENGAADILGLKPSTLDSRMIKLGIKRPARL
jgi:transcriptional regulator with GAF, ATPase, and Fis domain